MAYCRLSVALGLAITSWAYDAPLPVPKPVAVPALVGPCWKMTHAGREYWAIFGPSGTYEAGRWQEPAARWRGRWWLLVDRLVVREIPLEQEVLAEEAQGPILWWTAQLPVCESTKRSANAAWQGEYFDSQGGQGVFRLVPFP